MYFIYKIKYIHGKKFGTDAAPSGRAVAPGRANLMERWWTASN